MISSRWHLSGEMRQVLRGGHRLRFRAPARKEDHLPRFEACDPLRARDHDHLEELMKQRQKLKDDISLIRILGRIWKNYGEVNWYNWALRIWMNLMDFQELDWLRMWQYAALILIRYVYSIDHVTCSTYVCICAAAILANFELTEWKGAEQCSGVFIRFKSPISLFMVGGA